MGTYFLSKLQHRYPYLLPLVVQPNNKHPYHFQEYQSWEGNIRELENVIQRSLVIAQGASITSSTLSILPGQHVPSLTEQKVELLTEASKEVLPLEMVEKQTIEHAIKIKKGNLLQVAKALKISRTTLYSKIKKYNIKLDS